MEEGKGRILRSITTKGKTEEAGSRRRAEENVASRNLRGAFGKDVPAKGVSSQTWTERAPLDLFFTVFIK